MLQVKTPSFVAIDGRKMAYDEVSPANPKGAILLLTGLASKRLGWYRQINVFGQQYRTIALDHRDTGDSDPSPTPYTTADQADDTASVLKALGIARAHMIGISMGGFIALELALRHPQMVDRLVLTSTSAGGPTHVQPGPEVSAMLMRDRNGIEIGELAKQNYKLIMAPGYCESHPDDWERIAENARYRPQTMEMYLRQLQACMGHNVSDRLSEIKAPTLVVHGDVDPLIPPDNGRYLAAHIPGAKLIMYHNVGHIPIVERADDYNREVLAFLERNERAGE
jgi:pimeloyl-ACP methyl ester carboxylesterase